MKKREVAARDRMGLWVFPAALNLVPNLETSVSPSLANLSSLAPLTIFAAMSITGSLIFIAHTSFGLAPNSTPFTPQFVLIWFLSVSITQALTCSGTSSVLSTRNNPFERFGQPSRRSSSLGTRLRFTFLFISPPWRPSGFQGVLAGKGVAPRCAR